MPARTTQPIERRLFYALAGVALIYAFLAGLATVGDPDFGWQLARGRWIVQHHQVFSTDVLSYTVPGAPAIYPALGGVFLYWVFLIGGYKALSWLCATVCVASVALLLRRGSVFTAAIAILVMPFMALRMAPRSELFAIVLFAAYVSILWENYQTGRARLWLLPLLMALWVNIHFSFFSAFGLLAAFAGIDMLELLAVGERRANAIRRLKHEIPWFLGTLAATLVNPWGWRIYKETAQYTDVALAIHVNEWDPLHWNWTNPFVSFTLRNTNDLGHVVFLVILISIAVALFSRQLGAALLLVAATYEVTHHLRFLALASCIVVVVAGAVLASATPWIRSRIPNPKSRLMIAATLAGMFAALAVMRSLDVVSNYHYLAERNLSTFGTGLSGTFPQPAALFIQNQNLPGEVFNTYNEGGYTLWALGPQRRDYVDGREIPFGAAFLQHAAQITTTPLDSNMWQQEADRYGINTLILPLTMDEIPLDLLKGNCDSKQWRPVYLDEVSIVLLRSTPQNEGLIKRFAVDCATAPIPRDPLPLTGATFNQWVNAARVLSALGRQPEALAAADKAMSIFPDNAQLHWYRGQILYASDRHSEAEAEWQKALALSPRAITPWASLGDFQASIWSSLAQLYHHERSVPEETQALQAMLRLSTDPSVRLQAMMSLGSLYHAIGRDSDAEKQWNEALTLDPKESVTWFLLADVYQRDGRLGQAIHALEQGIAFSSDAATKAHAEMKVARLYLMSHRQDDALQALDEAARVAPPDLLADKTGRSFSFDIAQGRAAAWASKGDLAKATSFEEHAVQLNPDAPDAWAHLAKLYQKQGRLADQQRAENSGKKLLAATPQPPISN